MLFWLLAQQGRDAKGIPNGEVAPGWRERVAVEMSLPPSQVWRSLNRLKIAGVLVHTAWDKAVRISPDAFNL